MTILKNDGDVDANDPKPTAKGTPFSSHTNYMSVSYALIKTASIIIVNVRGSNGSGTMSHVVNGVLGAA